MIAGWWIWVAVASAALGGLMAVVQHALRDISRHGIEQAAAQRATARSRPGPTSAHGSGPALSPTDQAQIPRAVARLAADIHGHVAAVALPRVGLNLLAGVAMVLWVAHARGEAAPGVADVAIGLGSGVLVIWLLSVAIPLAIAEHAAEETALSWLWLVRLCHALFTPLRAVLRLLAEIVRRLTGGVDGDDLEAREAELLSLVEESRREGQLDETAQEMIEAVVEFRSTTVEQIMTPRTELEALPYTDDLAAVSLYVKDNGHSRIPVYREDLDHIEGVLYAKDLLRWMVAAHDADRASFRLAPLLRSPTFVPETKTVRELLAELLEQKVHIAIVIDEYGGTSGVVTMEDIVEEIFGEIHDEYEPEDDTQPPVEVDLASGVAAVDGRAEIHEANDALEALGLEFPEHDDYDTVGGFVVTRLGKIPGPGERLHHDGLVVTVLEAEPTRVLRVSVRRAEPQPTPDSAPTQAPDPNPDPNPAPDPAPAAAHALSAVPLDHDPDAAHHPHRAASK